MKKRICNFRDPSVANTEDGCCSCSLPCSDLTCVCKGCKKTSNSKFRIMARQIAHESVRNTFLEELHSGTAPSSKKGDWSDVYVVSPYGNIPWKKLSKINDEEMRKLMLEVENNLRRSLWFWDRHKKDQKQLLQAVEKAFFGEYGISWDDPTLSKS